MGLLAYPQALQSAYTLPHEPTHGGNIPQGENAAA
jgi:hypothetical protein